MDFDTLSALVSITGSFALVLLGLCLIQVLYQLRRIGRQTRTAIPSKTLNVLVIVACVISMICAAARAWQFSVVGH